MVASLDRKRLGARKPGRRSVSEPRRFRSRLATIRWSQESESLKSLAQPFISVILSPMSCRWITLLLPVGLLFAQVQTKVQSGDVVLRGGWLFDSIHVGVRRNTGILVRNGEFLEVDAGFGGHDLRSE